MMVVIGGRIENEEKNIRQTIRGVVSSMRVNRLQLVIEVVCFGSVKYS